MNTSGVICDRLYPCTHIPFCSEAGETEIFLNDLSNAAAASSSFSFSRGVAGCADPSTAGGGGQMRKKTRPLRLKKKLYEFYAAPITKYYSHCVSQSVDNSRSLHCDDHMFYALLKCHRNARTHSAK